MTALDDARANLDAACESFNRCANSTTPPGMLQKAVRDLMVAVDDYAEIRRSGVNA